MSEINNKEVNESKETSESTETKELSTAEKFDKLSDDEKINVLKEQQLYKQENPDAKSEDVGKFVEDSINKKYEAEYGSDEAEDGGPEEPEREKADDLKRSKDEDWER